MVIDPVGFVSNKCACTPPSSALFTRLAVRGRVSHPTCKYDCTRALVSNIEQKRVIGTELVGVYQLSGGGGGIVGELRVGCCVLRCSDVKKSPVNHVGDVEISLSLMRTAQVRLSFLEDVCNSHRYQSVL